MIRAKIPYAGKDAREEPLDSLETTVLRLWRSGLDTDRISRKLVIRESIVANHLALARDRA